MKYFQNCRTKEEVKSHYKTLAKQHHPDKGGNTATMQEINSEYAKAINQVLRADTSYNYTEEEINSEILNAEQYAQAVNVIINREDITIELCGGWLWVTPKEDKDF